MGPRQVLCLSYQLLARALLLYELHDGAVRDSTYLCQCLTMASVELTMVPSISKRMPLNVWVSAGAVKVPPVPESRPSIVRLHIDMDDEGVKREAQKYTRKRIKLLVANRPFRVIYDE